MEAACAGVRRRQEGAAPVDHRLAERAVAWSPEDEPKKQVEPGEGEPNGEPGKRVRLSASKWKGGVEDFSESLPYAERRLARWIVHVG